ncbi:MAG TPA: hypothetical protein PKI55_09155, partial [Chitinophagaceae bacterium]|nr:hypothetical protein [Chitinophagaceae bacterium]
AAPTITTNKSDKISISWSHPDEKDVFRWVVYYKYGNNWNYIILNRNDRSYSLNNSIEINKTTVILKQIAVTAIDRTGNESVRKEITVQ